MKHQFTLVISFFILFLVLPGYSQDLKQELKEKKKNQRLIDKTYKDKIAALEKDGYRPYATTKTLGELLYAHDKKLKTNLYEQEIIVTQTNCPTINLCARKSENNAVTQYASRTNAFVLGKIASEIKMNGNPDANRPSDDNIDKFGELFKTSVSANVSNALQLSYALITESKKGIKMQFFYLAEKEEAKRARKLALQSALATYQQAQAETDANINWMGSIEQFVEDTPVGSN